MGSSMGDRAQREHQGTEPSERFKITSLRKVGRPRRELVDTTPFSAAHANTGPREAWILRAARSAHPDPGVHKGSTFQALLALHGRSVSQASISRWESGEMQMPSWVPGLYERALGHAIGTLQAPINGLRRSLTRANPRPQPLLEYSRDSVSPSQLVEKLLTSEHDGHDWFQFAAIASRDPSFHLSDDRWTVLVGRLLDEMCRSVGLAYTLRVEALAALAADDDVLAHVVRAIGVVVMDPASQGIADAISLLDFVPGDRGTNLTIKLLHHDRVEVRQAATALAATRLARGDVSRLAMPAMDRAVAHVVAQTTYADPTLIDLVNRLPRRTPQVDALIANLRAQHSVLQVQSTGELVREDLAHIVTRKLAHEAAQHSGSGDPLGTLPQRLLREALFNAYLDRRHQSSMLLTMTHWRTALAKAVVRELVEDVDPMMRGCLVRLETYLATPEVVPDLASAAAGFTDARGDCVVAIAHSGIRIPETVPVEKWLVTSTDSAERSQLLYAMGMTRHPALARIADDPRDRMQAYARWWRARGGAVFDTV
jgi:hypothetical protein